MVVSRERPHLENAVHPPVKRLLTLGAPDHPAAGVTRRSGETIVRDASRETDARGWLSAVLTRDSSRHSHQRVAQSRRDPCGSCMSAGGSSQDARRTGSPLRSPGFGDPPSFEHPSSARRRADPRYSRPQGGPPRPPRWKSDSVRKTDLGQEDRRFTLNGGHESLPGATSPGLPSAHAPKPSTHVGEPATSQGCTLTRCVEGPSQSRFPSSSTSSIS